MSKDIAKAAIKEDPPPNTVEQQRAQTKATRAAIETAIVNCEGVVTTDPNYWGYYNDGPVEPLHGADSAYEIGAEDA